MPSNYRRKAFILRIFPRRERFSAWKRRSFARRGCRKSVRNFRPFSVRAFSFFCLRLSETEVPTGGSDVFFGKKGSGLFFREQGRRRGGDFVSDSSNGNANFVSRGGISALFLFRRDKTGYICTVTLCGASRLRSTGISCGNDAEALPRKGFPKSANAFEIRKAGRKGMRRSRNSIASVAANRAKRGRFFPWLNGGTE